MRFDREARSVVVVLLVSLAALTAGWTVRAGAVDPVRRVAADGVSVELPTDWLAAMGDADVAVTAHSLSPVLERIQVGMLPLGGEAPLEEIATSHSAHQAQQRGGYRVVGEGQEVVLGRPAHAVSYAFLEESVGALPMVVEGQAYYVRFGDQVVVASVEAETAVFPDALDRFSKVLQSVRVDGDES